MGGEYPARFITVYDGDTITAHVELGLDVMLTDQKFRLYGINAPELRGESKPEGIKARDYLRKRIDSDMMNVTIRIVEDRRGNERKGKYGR